LIPRAAQRACRLAWLTAQAWLGLAAFDLARLAGFANLHRALRTYRVKAQRSSISIPAASEVVWAVDEACVWYVKHAACLQRSAVATWLLRRLGLPAELVVGFRPRPCESHAWVEIDGHVVNDRPQYQKVFTVLERL
jgi:hypothetical protein